jgi:hypothetical protein
MRCADKEKRLGKDNIKDRGRSYATHNFLLQDL